MDSNQTRFHLLLGQNDWATCTNADGSSVFQPVPNIGPPFSWNSTRSEITLGKRVNLFQSSPGNQPPTIDQRRGAAQDRFGNWYFIGGSRDELLVTSAGTAVTTHFWSSTDEISQGCNSPDAIFNPVTPPTLPPALVFSGLAVTDTHYLVVGVLKPQGFLVFDLFHGGPPRQYVWPPAIAFEPFDMAPAPGGGVWILDRTNRRIWALDRSFSVVRQDQASIAVSPGPENVFAPADGSAPPSAHSTFPVGIALDLGSPLGAIDAIAIEALPDNTVLLLESLPANQFSTVYRMRYGSLIGQPVSLSVVTSILAPADQAGFSLLGFDFTMIPVEQTPAGQRSNTLYVVAANGDQAWAFTAGFSTDQLTLTPLEEFYPMRLFGGRAIVRGPSQVYYDSQDRFVPLVMQRRPRYVDQATLATKVFDSHSPDTVWHKLMLDASIPAETQVTVFSRAHNDPDFLMTQAWLQEPGPYKRGNGTELPFTTLNCLDTWELLFQSAMGQYMQLQIVLTGNGRLTPRIRALRAYYPRFSYLEHYLPGAYREDQRSASFLDRFLANFEGFYTNIEDRVATVQALLDAASAPSEALNWLANWFGVALDPSWSDAKRRLFLLNAATFFESRGTLPGVMMALRLTLEDCADSSIFTKPVQANNGPRLVEKFTTRRIPLGLLQDTPGDAGLPTKLQTAIWTPAQGADDLDKRYQDSLNLPAGTRYPISLDSSDANYSAWSSFSTATIGLVPGQPDPGSDLWATFLRSRYAVIDALNSAYGTNFGGFDDVPFPSDLPRKPQPLTDWYQFQGALLVQSTAHQFTIFLPVAIADAQNTEAQKAKLDLAQRVVALEKPAHTTFEIKFYWAFFRVGDARLGSDTVLDHGSRAPQLLQPVVLNDTYVGSGYIARQKPCDPRTRQFLKPQLFQRSCQ
ncbi:MAG TPA: phage tail protein [Bryobacteraceae bacterium]|nr:phage tail protein [Bryobacteraceae bacterium]